MVDSRNFKNFKTNKNEKVPGGIKKNKWVPFVIIVILAIALIVLNYFMMDVLQWANESMSNTTEEITTSAVQLIQSYFVI